MCSCFPVIPTTMKVVNQSALMIGFTIVIGEKNGDTGIFRKARVNVVIKSSCSMDINNRSLYAVMGDGFH